MRRGITGNIHHGDGLLTSWVKSSEQKKIKVRKSLIGYPKEFKFNSTDDIENYFNNEKLICLLCGKNYRFLTIHLIVHGHDALSYKEKYGINDDRGLVGTGIRKRMQEVTKERNDGDLKEAINIYNETRELKTHCPRGHLYNKKRKCQICDTNFHRKRNDHLPREVAAKTLVLSKCTNCGKDTIKTKLGRSRPLNYCSECKQQKYYESQKKYAENNKEKRRTLAKINYQKRKENIHLK